LAFCPTATRGNISAGIGRWASEHEDVVMSAEKPAANDKVTVAADNPEALKGTLKRIGGSQSDH
jgi:hypothetical protein